MKAASPTPNKLWNSVSGFPSWLKTEADAAKAFKLVKDIASWLPEETVTLVQGEIEKWLATDQPDLDDPLMEPVAPVVNVYILSGWWKGDDQEANAPACTFALEEDHLPKNGWTCQGSCARRGFHALRSAPQRRGSVRPPRTASPSSMKGVHDGIESDRGL